jgi:Restriction endonuclease NotI
MAAKTQTRFGIGEWYGNDFASLKPDAMRKLAGAKAADKHCRFRGGPCNKKGGVCSLRLYERRGEDVSPAGGLVTTCPQRFKEADRALTWIAQTLIGTDNPAIIKEVPFLKSALSDADNPEAVGQVDMVLVNQAGPSLAWCCVEMQAVYFSGPGMESEFSALAAWKGPGVPFSQKLRRPDFRSSGPKRLMPQLQIKVPTIRRWGKKMAVLIDVAFWRSLGAMSEVPHMSNCDVAWFVVDYELGTCTTRSSLHHPGSRGGGIDRRRASES